MATVTSAADGLWSDGETWDGGSVPASGDTAVIQHRVSISADVTVNAVEISGGSLTVADTYSYGATPLRFTCTRMQYDRRYNDTGTVRLDGVVLNITPCLSCHGSGDGRPPTGTLMQDTGRNILVTDGGYFTTTSNLQDQKVEGCGHAYAIKRGNNVRSHSVAVMIKADRLGYVGEIIRMAESPFQVLAVTNSCIIKGFIESAVPVSNETGKGYITVRLTIVEGQ